MGIKVEMFWLNRVNVIEYFETLVGLERYYRLKFNTNMFNEVTYRAFPAPLGCYAYNSNSFIHGLLRAAEIKLGKKSEDILISKPNFNIPGWDKPLPSSYFGVV